MLALVGAFASVSSVGADSHECAVAGVAVDCDDPGVTDEHGENCAVWHYHGDLNGVPDPNEYGCGHGEVTDGPPPPAVEEESSNWETFTDWADALFQGISGGFSPKAVAESTDIVVDASEGIAANAENAEAYFEAYPDAPDRDRYTLADETEDHGWLYNAFWGLFE